MRIRRVPSEVIAEEIVRVCGGSLLRHVSTANDILGALEQGGWQLRPLDGEWDAGPWSDLASPK